MSQQPPSERSPQSLPADTEAFADTDDSNWRSIAGDPQDFATLEFNLGSVGAYQLRHKLGEGGMGAVYRASHEKLARDVAVKILPRRSARHPKALARFAREIKIVAALSHPNIVRALDAGEEDSKHYLVMELVEGRDLAKVLRSRGPLPVEEAVNLVRQAAVGLAYAHERGVIHRDIKPANLLFDTDGVVKILDLGLARLENELGQHSTDALLTRTNQVMGTFDFMSPEQAVQTRDVDHRTDIYSLGCTLFTLLTGKPVFAGDTPVNKVMAHRDQSPPALGDHREDSPSALDQVFRMMVAKNPDDRYQSMDDVIAALDGVAIHDEVKSGPAPSPVAKPTGKQRSLLSRPRWLAALVGGLCCLLLAAWAVLAPSREGHIVVESEQPDVQLELFRAGAVVDRFAANQRESPYAYPTGVYEIRLTPGNEHLKIEGGAFKLSRGDHHHVQVVRRDLHDILTASDWSWSRPKGLENLNSGSRDGDFTMTADGLVALFASSREGTLGRDDLWQCTRESLDAPWSSPESLGPQVNSSLVETSPAISADGLTLIFSSNRGPSVGGRDLFISRRASRGDPWPTPKNLGQQVNTPADETDPALTRDGRVLIYASNQVGGQGGYDLFQASRASLDDRFADPKNLGPGVNSSGAETGPALSADESVLIFASVRSAGSGRSDLWISTRAGGDDEWSAPINLGPQINGPGNEFSPEISTDGRKLYFTAFNVEGGMGQGDICSAARVPAASVQPNSVDPVDGSADHASNGSGDTGSPVPDGPPLAMFPLTSTEAQAYQKKWAEHFGVSVERNVAMNEDVSMTFRFIPPGEFMMGSDADDLERLRGQASDLGDHLAPSLLWGEQPAHRVTFTRGFYLGKHEVTWAQWKGLMEVDAPDVQTEHPAIARWTEVRALIGQLNAEHSDPKLAFALPTEAQWEYACAAGATTEFSHGDDLTELDAYAWTRGNSNETSNPVAQLKPNAWGLHDMHGNVWEWCADWHDTHYYRFSGRYDPQGPLSGLVRIVRGGSFRGTAAQCRTRVRNSVHPTHQRDDLGFRLVLTLPKQPATSENDSD